jgi:hypothetical protein
MTITDPDRRAAISLTGPSSGSNPPARISLLDGGWATSPVSYPPMPRAAAGNQMYAHDNVAAPTRHRDSAQTSAEDTWENEGGRLAPGPDILGQTRTSTR